jgi:hypothetical protein
MRHVRPLASTAALLTLVSLAGCGEPEGPDLSTVATGTWVLQSIEGQPLPVNATGPSGCRLTIDSSRVVLPGPCSANRCGSWVDYFAEGPPPSNCASRTFVEVRDVVFALSASDRLTIDVIYPAERRPQIGQIQGDQLTFDIENALLLPDGRYVYRRRD